MYTCKLFMYVPMCVYMYVNYVRINVYIHVNYVCIYANYVCK